MSEAVDFLRSVESTGFGFPVTNEGYVQLCFLGLTDGTSLRPLVNEVQAELWGTARLSYTCAYESPKLHETGHWSLEVHYQEWAEIPRLLNHLLSYFPQGTLWLTMRCSTLHARFVSWGRNKPFEKWSWRAVEHRVVVAFFSRLYPSTRQRGSAADTFKYFDSPKAWLRSSNWKTHFGKWFCRQLTTALGLEPEPLDRKAQAFFDFYCKKHKVLSHGGW